MELCKMLYQDMGGKQKMHSIESYWVEVIAVKKWKSYAIGLQEGEVIILTIIVCSLFFFMDIVTNTNHGVKDALYRIFKFIKSLKDQIRVGSEQAEVSQEGQLQIFKFNELWVATNRFAVENIIGRGEFTIVYKGIVDNIPVTVKKWKSYADGLQEWEVITYAILAIIVCSLFFFMTIVTNRNHGVKDAFYRIFKSIKSLKDQIRVGSEQAEVSQEGQLHIFRFNELWAATNHFAVENIIGRGEFTIVYRGIVDNIPVAVKKWESYADGLQEWENEMNVLCNKRHPNLIKLLGFCNEDDEIILIYELMNNGDLEQLLNKRDEPLSWEQRIKIATGAARSLAFLHTPENNIIHRVIKPSVILLDQEFNVKLSGMGCSREGPTNGATRVSTQLTGTAGYVDPQYAMTGRLDAKTDVYAFGIVMLQLLSGLKVFDLSQPPNKQHLVSYASRFITAKNKLLEFMDPTLGNRYRLNHAFILAKLCALCTSFDGDCRPHMKTILEILETICSIQVEACLVSSPFE